MKVEQFVMAYQVEQDRLRALLPDKFESLRPVLRINAEIRNEQIAYLEFNTAVASQGKRGWLNIAHWSSETHSLTYKRNGKRVTFTAPFLMITYSAVGIEGSCPAEQDNDGCFFLDEAPHLNPPERITVNKEFCDCEFAWSFHDHDAHGASTGKTIPAFFSLPEKTYEKRPLSAENAAAIPCQQILGSYVVMFER